MDMKAAIAEVINGRSLTRAQAEATMQTIMAGEATQAQIGSYLTALRMKGETVEEIAGSAAAMRGFFIPVNVPHTTPLFDVVGTGGDGKHTFNISTTAAFVVAGAGERVAKHGNRAASSRSGSADVLMSLGANLELDADGVAQCINSVGIGFMYAIKHHPAMRHAISPRREIAQRTIFNLLGPLTNPAGATHLMIGVYDPELTEPIARTLQALGAEAAIVVHGAGGLDELSCLGPNKVSRLQQGVVSTQQLDPHDYGLERATLEDYIGGVPKENAAITRAILSGKDHGPRRDVVLLNAASALSLLDGDLEAALVRAAEAIDSGVALAKLNAWVAQTNS